MSHKSPQTLIGIVRSHIELWRQREGWTQETMAAFIVETHEAIGGPSKTGIQFRPATQDAFIRARVNAERIFRWLDDETKDINLVPANFLHSVMMAMPEDIRLYCIDALLSPLGLAARGLCKARDGQMHLHKNLRDLIRDDADAHAAYLALVESVGPLSIDDVLMELNQSIETKLAVRHVLEASLDTMKGVSHFARGA